MTGTVLFLSLLVRRASVRKSTRPIELKRAIHRRRPSRLIFPSYANLATLVTPREQIRYLSPKSNGRQHSFWGARKRTLKWQW